MVEILDVNDTQSEESNVDDTKYLNNFNEFVNQLKIIFINNDIQQILNDLLQLSNEDKINNGKNKIERQFLNEGLIHVASLKISCPIEL